MRACSLYYDYIQCLQRLFERRMSYLKKVRNNNLKIYEKCCAFLRAKGLDINNLPRVEAKKPVIEVKQAPVIKNIPRVEHERDDSDSQEVDLNAYLQAQKSKGGQGNNNERQGETYVYDGNGSKPKFKSNDFNLSEYSYHSASADIASYGPMVQVQNKRPSKRIREKQIFNNNWKVIDQQAYQNKTKIQQVIKNNEPIGCNYISANNKEWQNSKKNEDHKLYYILSKFPKIRQFKNNQKAIIKCGLQNHDIFVCMPTGGGKSLTFQILTFLIKGVYLCILPLVSLIFDQEYQAKMLGIEAYSLTANMSQGDTKMIYNKLLHFDRAQKSIVLFCTPEKLNLSPAFSEVLDLLYQNNHLKRVVIDEVHCVSTWGKQFRIQYENLSSVKKKYPKTPILALTATVTEVVKQDIIRRLGIQNCYFFQSSFNRPNLYYEVKNKDKNIMSQIMEIINKYRNKSGIIYCLSRKSCEEMSHQLNKKGIKASFYHGQISEQEKKTVQQSWMKDQTNIIVATVAFGMGINKPDVRFVIHHSMSKSLENYYQESGRAGRDGEYSECILFYRKLDKQSLMSMTLKNDFSTKENKQFSTKQLAQMIKYCEDKYTCRRQFQLKYLGQTDFNPETCQKTCDNCKKQRQFQEFECVDEAKTMIKILMKLEEIKISVSRNQLISILKNKIQKNKGIGYKIPQMTKAGIVPSQLQQIFDGWKAEDLQFLLLEFMSHDIVTERIVENQVYRNKIENNVSNVYLKCHVPRCRIFLQQVETLPIKRQVKGKTVFKPNQTNTEDQGQDIDQAQNAIDDESSLTFANTNPAEDSQQRETRYKQILETIFDDDD